MFLNADGRLTETGLIGPITLSSRLFQMVGPATGKARPPTVDSFTDGTSRQYWSEQSGGNVVTTRVILRQIQVYRERRCVDNYNKWQ